MYNISRFLSNCKDALRGERGPALAFVIALGVLLHVTGIENGLPSLLNGDEPHHVNIAVSFGRGSLDPGVFKYPTLWMYLLFVSYGLYFLLWSGFGLLHSVGEFGQLFVWDHSAFYLIGRFLSASLALAGAHRIYRSAESLHKGTGLWAGALIAVSPALVWSSHSAKPDCLMFFCSAWAWWFAIRYFQKGNRQDLFLAACMTGLSISSQYTAAPLAILLPAAWWARRMSAPGRAPVSDLAAALVIIPAAFLAGSPYIPFRWSAFWIDFQDNWNAFGTVKGVAGASTYYNMITMFGHWIVGGVLLVLGASRLLQRRRAQALLLLAPIAVCVIFFSLQMTGYNKRYLFGILPAAAMVAAMGVEYLREKMARGNTSAVTAGLLFLVMTPGAWSAWSFDREMLTPDTRSIASAWIKENIPPDAVILSDHETDSPRIAYSLKHAKRLYEKTKKLGHPRWRYYEKMVAGHPGGGYAVYQVVREAWDIRAGLKHTGWSEQGRPVLDVRPGLRAALDAGIEVVVLNDLGVAHPRADYLKKFVRETEENGTLLALFERRPGIVKGPLIRIYRIR